MRHPERQRWQQEHGPSACQSHEFPMAARSSQSAERTSSHAVGSVGSATAASDRRASTRLPPSTTLAVPSTSTTVASRSRHSLYGAEDRVVLDLGSRVWKVGFSGESAPRAVFDVGAVWKYDCGQDESRRSVARGVRRWLKRAFYE